MRRLSKLCLIAWFMIHGREAAGGARPISGPDGPRPPRPATAPAQPSLEEQLRRRKQAEPDAPTHSLLPKELEPAASAEELLGPGSKSGIDPGSQGPQAIVDPIMRMGLSLAPARVTRGQRPFKAWGMEPGARFETSWRLTRPELSHSFWMGVRMAAWNGSARSTTSLVRFASLYVGPLVTWEWRPVRDAEAPLASYHLSLSAGIAAVSRQVDPDFPGESIVPAAQKIAFDGPGLWLDSGYSWQLTDRLEAETRLGIQTGKFITLTYASMGVSLWTN